MKTSDCLCLFSNVMNILLFYPFLLIIILLNTPIFSVDFVLCRINYLKKRLHYVSN